MKSIRTKEAAEAVLLELPSVLGAHVREDIYGHPREVHLLVAPGPDVRHLARDIRDLLEERLGVPVDQRVISIAQLADLGAAKAAMAAADGQPKAPSTPATVDAEPRLAFQGIQTSLAGGKVTVQVRLGLGEQELTGTSSELDSDHGRMRAAATAVLQAVKQACGGSIRWELDGASLVRAFEHDYVLVAVHATAPRFGRQPLLLAGAHPAEDGLETAAALAVLKATNRLLAPELNGERD